ncbi:MAG: hypothetical protein M3032_11535 [Verrucomicrobiota bacterium]|nr:hypothetical protein [Verrucomicrobiota bacterium]
MNPEVARAQRFYFALPRLVAWRRGRNAHRSERNGLEANAVGAVVHLTVYAFAFELCLTSLSAWKQLLWAVPLAFLVWIAWLNVMFVNSLVIRCFRATGLMRALPQGRAQSILIGAETTLCALRLIRGSGWTALLGFIWIAAVAFNLLAAALLAVSRAEAK